MKAIMLVGRPCSGKGTLAQKLGASGEFEHISSGDLLREAKARGGPEAEELKRLDKGQFASDELIMRLLAQKLASLPASAVALLDGVPRTLAQWEKLNEMGVMIAGGIELEVEDIDALIRRASERRIGVDSKKVYGPGEAIGERTIQREDDKPEVARARQIEHDRQVEPMLKQARAAMKERWVSIDAMQDPVAIEQKALAALRGWKEEPGPGSGRRPK